MSDELYFEDFFPGQVFDSLYSYRVKSAEIIGFGERYDPQPFHIDEAAGENSFFHGLAASGWLTAAIAMRLRVQSIKVSGGMIDLRLQHFDGHKTGSIFLRTPRWDSMLFRRQRSM